MADIAGPTLALGIDGSGAQRGASQFQQATQRIQQSGQQATKSVEGISNSISGLGAVSKTVSFSLGLLGGAFAALSLTQIAQDVIKVGDAYSLLDARLKLATGSTYAATAAHKGLLQIAQATSASFEDVSSLYIKLAQSSKAYGLSAKDAEGITKTITEALAVSGASAEATSASILQLGQALSSGVLQGDEFRSLSEQFPALLDIIADATGKARGELKQLGSDGQLSARVIIESIQSQSDVVHAKFTEMGDTVGKASTRMQNAWNELLVELNKTGGVTEGLTTTIQNFTNFLQSPQGKGTVETFGAVIAELGHIMSQTASEFQREASIITGTVGAIGSAMNWLIEQYKGFRSTVRGQLGMSEGWNEDTSQWVTKSDPNAKLTNPENIAASFGSLKMPGTVKLDPVKAKAGRGGSSRNTELRDQARAVDAVADANRELLQTQIQVQQQYGNQLKAFELQKQELELLHQSEIRKLDDLKLSAEQKSKILDDLNKKYALLNQAIDSKRNAAILNAQNWEGKPADTGLTVEGNVNAQFPQLGDFPNESQQVNTLLPDWEKYFQLVNDTNDATTNLAKGTRSFVDDLSDGLVQAIAAGAKLEDIFLGLAQSIAQAVLKAIIFQTIMASIGGIGSSLGFGGGAAAGVSTGSTSAMVAHTGGIVGSTSLPMRQMPAIGFANAPRFHRGGEVNAVLKRGEGVFTPEQMKAMGGSNVQVNIINNSGAQVSTQESRTDKGITLDVIVDQVEGMISKRMARQGSKSNTTVKSIGGLVAR